MIDPIRTAALAYAQAVGGIWDHECAALDALVQCASGLVSDAVAAERERAAMVCEEQYGHVDHIALSCAEAIRRG